MRPIIITLLLCALSCVQAADPGAIAALDISVIEQAKDVYFDYLMDVLKNVQIPDINFHGGYIHGNTFTITEAANNVQISADPDHNGLQLSVNSLGANFHSSSFEYKISFLKCKGSVSVDISQMTVRATVGLTTQNLADGKTVPGFTVPQVYIDLPKDHINIHIHGNIVAKIADAFKSLFMGTIRDQITKNLNDVLVKQVPPELNKITADQKGFTEIFNNLDLDWSLPDSPKITSSLLSFGAKGLFFPKNESEVEPPVTPPAMPLHDDQSPSKFQFFLSNYVVDSIFYSYLRVNEIHFWTMSSAIPKSFPIQLDTTSLNHFFPGLKDHYGDGLPVDVEYKVEKAENFEVKENDQTMAFDGDLAVKFWVNMANGTKEAAVDIVLEKTAVNFTALIVAGTQLQANVTSAGLYNIHVTSTTFGDLDLNLLTELLNKGAALGLPFFNKWISTQKVTIPTKLFGLFTLSDLVIKYHDGFLMAGLTPTFLPPSETFVPGIKSDPYNDSDVFEEWLDENGNYSSNVIREFTFSEIFGNHVQAFKELILTN